jgi:dihydroxy-acid dehydratase
MLLSEVFKFYYSFDCDRGRIGVELNLEDFDKLGSKIPLLLNLMPSGKYLMEDFYYAGGLPVIINELKSLFTHGCDYRNGKNTQRKY